MVNELTYTLLPLAKLEVNKGQIEGVPKNPRFIRDNKFKQLVESISNTPEMMKARPLIVHKQGEKYVVLAGNMRLRAMRDLKWHECPCAITAEGTDAKKLREYAIKDNVAFGEDDMDALANEWDLEELTEWGMDIQFPEDISPEGFGEDFTLQSGDKSEFGVMNFTVTDKQRVLIEKALAATAYCEGFQESDNKNSNGAGLELIVRDWISLKMHDVNSLSEEEIGGKVSELREYLKNSLKASGITAAELDRHLGTNMSGHYFGQSQWMFPTCDAYNKMKEVMDLPRDYNECAKICAAYEFAKKIKEAYGEM